MAGRLAEKKKILEIIISVLLCLVFALSGVGCAKSIPQNKTQAGYVNVYPEKITGNLHNPGMGWVSLEEPMYTGLADIGGSGDIPMVDCIGIQTSWALIEKEEGVYDWSAVDDVFDYWTPKGKRFNIRITVDCTFVPNSYVACPLWLIDKYDIATKVYEAHGQTPVGYYEAVDVTDPNYLKHLDLFLAELNKYIKDKPVESIDLLGYGVWGEWHSGYDFESYEDRNEQLSNIINHWVDAFELDGQFLSLCAAWEYRDNTDPNVNINQKPTPTYEDYLYWSAFDYAMTQSDIGFRRNGGAGVLMYNTDERIASDYIRSGKRVPLMAEYYSSFEDQLQPYPAFNVMEGIDNILFKLRPNYCTVLGWANVNVQALYDLGVDYLYARGNEKFGYRLAIDKATYPEEVSAGNEIDILTQFSNSGVGRYWFDYPLQISLSDAEGKTVFSALNKDINLKSLLNGETMNVYSSLQLPDDLANGTYSLAVALVDEETGEPVIALGNGGDTDGDKRYILGDIKVKNNISNPKLGKSYSYRQIKDLTLKANTTYELTFEYTPGFSLENFTFNNYDGYEVYAASEKGGESATRGYMKWQDVSEERSYRTVRFTTGDYDDYKICFASDNFDKLTIGKCVLQEVSGYYTDFEKGYDEKKDVFVGNDYAYLTQTDKEIVSGSNSMLIESDEKGHSYGLSSDLLDANSTYTVTFDMRGVSDVGNGGYFFLSLGNSGESSDDVMQWYERPDSEPRQFTVTFRTSDVKERLWFGVHNRGMYSVDNIIITKEAKGTAIGGEDISEEENVPYEVNGGFGITEDFETKSFGKASWNYSSTNKWGIMTDDPDEVISGNVSLKGYVEDPIIGTSWEWIPFAQSKAQYLGMETGKAYRLTFKYKILSRYDGTGSVGGPFFYVNARPESQGMDYQCDQGLYKFGMTDEIGVVKSATVEFYLRKVSYKVNGEITEGVFDDYIIQFGMYLYNEIAIDDVTVEEIDVPESGYEFGSTMTFDGAESFVDFGFMKTNEYGGSELVAEGPIDGTQCIYFENDRWDGEDASYRWSTNLKSIPEFVTFDPNTEYRVTFNYQVAKALPKDSVGFQVYAESLSEEGVLGNAVRFGTGEAVGTKGSATYTFTTGELTDYSLMFGMEMSGACYIDNLKIEKVS